MKTIGLRGWMRWESTVPHSRTVNRVVARELGGLNSARVIPHSVNVADVVELPKAGRWHEAGALLADAARGPRAAGADVLVLCVNAMHRVADMVARNGGLPLLHVLDPTVAAIRAAGAEAVGVLATRFVMEGPFYRGWLAGEYAGAGS